MEIKSRLGSVALAIKATLKADKIAEASKLAATHILFHIAPSAVFNKEGAKRDDAYSDELAAKVVGAVRESFGKLFDNIEIASSEYVKVSEYSKFVKTMQGIGFDEKAIAEMWAKRPEQAESEAAG